MSRILYFTFKFAIIINVINGGKMKKIFRLMGCALLTISLTGCGSNPAPNNGNENVLSLEKGDFKITVNDLYSTLKEKYATNYLINEIDKAILNKEYETDDKANDYVENQMKIYKLYYSNNEQELLSAIQNAGYKDLSEFQESIITNYKRTLATDDYVKKTISDSEINKYYENNIYGDITVSHILISLEASDNLTDEEKKEAEKNASDKIKEIYGKLDNGTSFSEVAKEYSEDKATSSNGGRIGTFNKNEMTKQFNSEFEEAVINLKVGEYTKKAIKTEYGYHIIYKDAEKDKPELETVKQTIIESLLSDKKKEDNKAEYKAMIDLREKYGLSFNDEDIKSQYDNAINNWLYGE